MCHYIYKHYVNLNIGELSEAMKLSVYMMRSYRVNGGSSSCISRSSAVRFAIVIPELVCVILWSVTHNQTYGKTQSWEFVILDLSELHLVEIIIKFNLYSNDKMWFRVIVFNGGKYKDKSFICSLLWKTQLRFYRVVPSGLQWWYPFHSDFPASMLLPSAAAKVQKATFVNGT